MGHYTANVRDIEFNLFEVLGAADRYGSGRFASVDGDQARLLLAELARFAESDLWAGSFAAADRGTSSVSPAGDVTIPEPLDESLRAFYDAGWHLLALPEHLGGLGAPPSLRWAATELLAGGHAAASLWPIGPLMAMVVDQVGTAGQRERFAVPMVQRPWGASMVLTEPDAGSDVGAATTRAVRVADNGPDDLGSVHHLTGVKRFITSADAQTHENTVHLVLARPEGAGPGTKGLSLFLVPKFLVNADGTLGERNGVRVTRLEHKLGIRASATCELTFGVDGVPCVGYLAGDVHDGIRQMFLVIEYARMMVGTKAMATLSAGYAQARAFAVSRIQGPDLTRVAERDAPKVPIVDHPDVRRMLLDQKAHAEAMRALVLFTGWVQDRAAETTPHPATPAATDTATPAASSATSSAAAASSGPVVGVDDGGVVGVGRDVWVRREELLLPLVKGWCSEKAFELLSSSLQTLGGSGYTEEYPVEQYLRDAKIDTLYEGTTGIQALDLLLRKIVKDGGDALLWLTGEVSASLAEPDERFAAEVAALTAARDAVGRHVGVLVGHLAAARDGDVGRIRLAGLHATGLLFSLAELVAGWLLLRQGRVAAGRLADPDGCPERDRGFYEGKVASCRWFVSRVAPQATVRADLAAAEDGWVMGLPVGAL